MIEDEIKKEIINLRNKNRYYISKKEFCKILLEIVDDINPINVKSINKEIQDITLSAFDYVCKEVKVVLKRYHISKAAQ